MTTGKFSCIYGLPKTLPIWKVKVTQSCLTLCNPMDHTVHGILQARILEWVAIPFSRGSSWPRDWTRVFYIAGGFFTVWVIMEALLLPSENCSVVLDYLRPLDYIVHGIVQARILGWVAVPFSRGSSQPRDWTQVSHIAGRFFTSWATREAQEYWSGEPIPSPVDLLDPEIKVESPASQVDSLPAELLGNPILSCSQTISSRYTSLI